MKKKNKDSTKQSIVFFEECLTEVFEERKAVLITHMKKRLAEAVGGELSNNKKAAPAGWEEVDSLSKLRSLVGGRFENLKNKWLTAGFPIKQEKRGKEQEYTLNEPGWIELSSWVLNQGFEVRLNPDKKDVYFEIKQVL